MDAQQTFLCNFRFIFSYSRPFSGDLKNSSLVCEQMAKKRKQMINRFSNNNIASFFCWETKDLLKFLDGVVSFSLDSKIHRRHAPFADPIHTRCTQKGVRWIQNRQGIDIEKGSNKSTFLNFHCDSTPQLWSANAMSGFLGSEELVFARHRYPFFVHFGCTQSH